MRTIKFKVKGTSPLMLNNPQTVNPFNEYTKQIKALTSKKKKTEDDEMEKSRLSFEASWYIHNGIYVLPAQNFLKSIIDAAKERRLGKEIERSFLVVNEGVIDFADKDKSVEELYNMGIYVDIRTCGVMGSKITATRAIIPNWSIVYECMYDETRLDEDEIMSFVEIAGQRYGLGTYRRLYGRFEATKIA